MIVSVSIGPWWHLRKATTSFCRGKRALLEKGTTKLRTKGRVGVHRGEMRWQERRESQSERRTVPRIRGKKEQMFVLGSGRSSKWLERVMGQWLYHREVAYGLQVRPGC